MSDQGKIEDELGAFKGFALSAVCGAIAMAFFIIVAHWVGVL